AQAGTPRPLSRRVHFPVHAGITAKPAGDAVTVALGGQYFMRDLFTEETHQGASLRQHGGRHRARTRLWPEHQLTAFAGLPILIQVTHRTDHTGIAVTKRIAVATVKRTRRVMREMRFKVKQPKEQAPVNGQPQLLHAREEVLLRGRITL